MQPSSSQDTMVSKETKDIMVKLVTSLLTSKPNDPVPHIYSYLLEIQKGVDPSQIKAITDNELQELKNLEKKVTYFKDILHQDNGASQTESEEESGDEVEEIQPKKKNIKQARQGVSAEVYGNHNQKQAFVAKVITKTEETVKKLTERLMQSFMFQALDEKEFKIVVDAIEEVSGKAGEAIITEGDQGDCMFVLESGALDCTKVFAGNTDPTFLKEYKPGEGFGELALLYNAPRAATITSKNDYVCWKLDRDTFNNIVKDAATNKREKYDNFLQQVDILKQMDPYERSQLGDAIKESQHKKGDFVITEGEEGNIFYLIQEGTADATKNLGNGEPTIVKSYVAGNYFGERALLTSELRAANIVITSEECVVLSLDRDTFIRLLGPLQDILKRQMDEYNKFAVSN